MRLRTRALRATHLLVPDTSTTVQRLRLHHTGVSVQYEEVALRAQASSGNSTTCNTNQVKGIIEQCRSRSAAVPL